MTGEQNIKKVCVICGKEFLKSPYSHMNICGFECHRKKIWLDIIEEREKHVVIDGECYYLERNNLNGCDRAGFKGFGGRRFRIKFNNGEIIETTNLWHNGVIPDEFRNVLKDEAVFIETTKEGGKI